MTRHDQMNTGRSAYPGPATNSIRWKIERTGKNDMFFTDPIVGKNGSIYIIYSTYVPEEGPRKYMLQAINPDSTVKWEFLLPDVSFLGPISWTDTIYLVTGNYKKLIALNPDTGLEMWNFILEEGTFVSPPYVGKEGNIYIGVDIRPAEECGTGNIAKIYSIDPNTKQVNWNFALGCYSNVENDSIAIGQDETIYVSTQEYLYAIQENGEMKWNFPFCRHICGDYWNVCTGRGTSIGRDGVIFTFAELSDWCGEEHEFYAINPDGSLKWKTDKFFDVENRKAMLIGPDDTLYVKGRPDSVWSWYLFSVDQNTGYEKWRFWLNLTGGNSAIDKDGIVYVQGYWYWPRLHALNPNGTEKWLFTDNGPWFFGPTLGRDSVLYTASGGTYPAELWAIGPTSSPIADFVAKPTTGIRPLTVQFTDQSTGTVYNWQWNFGDGGTSTEQSPSNTYNTAGDFTVTLTVTGPDGSDSETKTNYIHVTEPITAITVLAPNGGEIIPSGSTYTIRWEAPSSAVKFDLQYSIDNGTTWATIATNVTETSYNWSVPTPTANKKQCFVKVTGYNSSGTKVGEDISDLKFTIEVVRLNSPNGGETLKSGTVHTITWTTNGTVRPVAKAKLFYSLDGGTTYTLIKTLTGNPGSTNWTVPTVTATQTKCKVKVVLKDSGGVTIGQDASNKNFTITP